METLNNDIKYGNFTSLVNKTEGFPLDQEALSMLQNNMRLMATMAELTGAQFLILCGCGSASSRQPGYVYARTSGLVGEILYYDGSAPTSGTCHIWEDSETVTANLVTFPNAYTRRCLRGGPHPSNSSQNLQWSSFKKFDIATMNSQIGSLLGTVSSLSSSISANSYMIAPIGSIQPFAGSSIPTGYGDRWKICDGSVVYRSAYPELAAVLGISSTSFALPNLKGKFLVGYNSGDTSFNNVRTTGGKKGHQMTTDNMPAHAHSVKDYYYMEGTGASGNIWGGRETLTGTKKYIGSAATDSDNNQVYYKTHDTADSGKSTPNDIPTLPPYYVVNYIIRVK